eukprot:6157461-Pleurochrysis_carterae.AAC.1
MVMHLPASSGGCDVVARLAADGLTRDESSRASIAASSESTSSQGWNGWSGSEDLPMRRAHAAPWPRSARFMTPLPSGTGGEACATRECGGSIDSASLGVGVALGSASVACRHSALPAASKLKGISPPSCTKSALRAVSDTGVSSALDSEDSEAASFARDSLLRRSFFAAVGALAPPARGPLVTPLLVRFRARAFGIGGLTTSFLAAILLAAYREGVCRARIGLELAAHVADFCITQYAASSRNREVEVTHARIQQHGIGQLSGDGERSIEPLYRMHECVECRHGWIRNAANL